MARCNLSLNTLERMIMLSSEFEYMESGRVVHMYAETTCGTEQYILGTFRPAQNGYYYFEPVNGAELSCKMLREAAKKVSELNTRENDNE